MNTIKLFGIAILTLASGLASAQKAKNMKIEVKAFTVNCSEQNATPCLQAKLPGIDYWVPIPNAIEGFNYVEGFDYRLKVEKADNLPDNHQYKLLKVLSKKPVPFMSIYNKKLQVTKINNQSISDTGIYATINPATQTISGKSGCNIFNVSYTLNKRGIMNVYSGMGTLMACDEAKMKLESMFLTALQNHKFKITEQNNVVTFTNQANKEVIEFSVPSEAQIWSYIDGKNWKLIQLDNVSKDFGNAAIEFNVAEKRVTGNAGCNRFFGNYTTNADQISFSHVGATRMMCGDDAMQTEDKLLEYLNSAELRFDVADQTLNFYKDNKLVMIFAK